jgi:NitT/TauT family transport system substrate-binding protein
MSMGFSMHSSVRLSRRQFVCTATGLGISVAGAPLLAACSRLGAPDASDRLAPATIAAPGTVLETTTLRFASIQGSACLAPEYVAEDLVRADGFTDVQYVTTAPADIMGALEAGAIDMQVHTVGIPIVNADTSSAVVVLAGVHAGCFELFANGSVRTIGDLRGKRVGVTFLGSGRHVHLAAMAAYVGVDPNREITWAGDPPAEAVRQLSRGEVDAYMAFAPEPQALRASGIGKPIVSTATDRPWSHYYCCVLTASRAFVERHPVATKRAVRAILKATDICANEPGRAAQRIAEHGIAEFDATRQSLRELPYNVWREYDPEDTVRFYSLLLQQVGMIKSTPDQVIKNGTDWRFLNELKRELKA